MNFLVNFFDMFRKKEPPPPKRTRTRRQVVNPVPVVEKKECRDCHQTKPITEYYTTIKKDGVLYHPPSCIECACKYGREQKAAKKAAAPEGTRATEGQLDFSFKDVLPDQLAEIARLAAMPWEPEVQHLRDWLAAVHMGVHVPTDQYNDLKRAYYNSKVYRARRSMIYERGRRLCEKCRLKPIQNVHHVSYQNLFNEPLTDLQGLCRDCHKATHPDARDDD